MKCGNSGNLIEHNSKYNYTSSNAGKDQNCMNTNPCNVHCSKFSVRAGATYAVLNKQSVRYCPDPCACDEGPYQHYLNVFQSEQNTTITQR